MANKHCHGNPTEACKYWYKHHGNQDGGSGPGWSGGEELFTVDDTVDTHSSLFSRVLADPLQNVKADEGSSHSEWTLPRADTRACLRKHNSHSDDTFEVQRGRQNTYAQPDADDASRRSGQLRPAQQAYCLGPSSPAACCPAVPSPFTAVSPRGTPLPTTPPSGQMWSSSEAPSTSSTTPTLRRQRRPQACSLRPSGFSTGLLSGLDTRQSVFEAPWQ
ncbi:hypothetical protein SRHO_G00170450 [Serrasalmus rhombeus]